MNGVYFYYELNEMNIYKEWRMSFKNLFIFR